MIEHTLMVWNLTEIAGYAKEILFPKGGTVPGITEPNYFFKLEHGFSVFKEDGTKMPGNWDRKTPCQADFLLCMHGVYTYDEAGSGAPKMKLVVKASQMKITAEAAAQGPKNKFSFQQCLI